jgi:molybdate transport system permease protein
MVALILTAYVVFVSSNAVYLGAGDAWHFMTQPKMWERFRLTALTATLATALSVLIGIPAGYAISRKQLPWPTLSNTLIDLPMMVPPAALGLLLLGAVNTFPVEQLLGLLGVRFGQSVQGVILVQFVVTVAFSTRLMKAAFDHVTPQFENVSRSLGASVPHTLVNVTLPLAKRGIIAGIMVVWARAAAEWEGLMLFVGGVEGRTDVLPFAVYLDWNAAMMGWVISMSLVCVLTAVVVMAAVRLVSGRSHVW